MYALISLPLVYCYTGASCKKCLYFRCMQPLESGLLTTIPCFYMYRTVFCSIYIYYNRVHCLCSEFIWFYSSSGIRPRLWPRERNNLETTLARNELINYYNYIMKIIN